MFFNFYSIPGIGTVAFDTRLGLYEDPPPQEALKFIEEVDNFFILSQKLMFNIPSRMARKYIDTPTFKKFLKSADAFLDIGQGFVNKKMMELKEMAEKGIDPSGDTQGVSNTRGGGRKKITGVLVGIFEKHLK